MRKATVLFKNEEAGILSQHDDGSFTFRYCDTWVAENNKTSISPTLPIAEREFQSNYLFPFFYCLLPEGSNKHIVCTLNRIDKDDHFGLLMLTAKYDCIGAIRIIKRENE